MAVIAGPDGVLNREWLVKFRFKVLLPIEQQGQFKAPLTAEKPVAEAMFKKWLKEAHPEIKNVEILEFDLSPITDKTVGVAVDAETVEAEAAPTTVTGETIN